MKSLMAKTGAERILQGRLCEPEGSMLLCSGKRQINAAGVTIPPPNLTVSGDKQEILRNT